MVVCSDNGLLYIHSFHNQPGRPSIYNVNYRNILTSLTINSFSLNLMTLLLCS